MVWILNHTDFKASAQAAPFKTSLDCLHIVQNHYPERLGLAVLYNFSSALGIFWAMFRPFIDPVTASKVQFINPSRDMKTTRQNMGKVRPSR